MHWAVARSIAASGWHASGWCCASRATASLAVLREPSMLRKGNGDGFDAALAEALPVGTECRILESRPGWLEVELGDSLRGWVKDTSVARVE